MEAGFARLLNLSGVSLKVVQRADAWIVGYSGELIASFIVGLDLETTSVLSYDFDK